jgi:DNA-binding MurR/RpiR family transcriptional regulator
MIAVISKIISMQSSFTVSENEIAQYVMNNADTVVASTISTVAKNTNTSDASINRFCKKLGFKGFNSFKIALAQENFYNTMKESSEKDEKGLITSLSQDYRQMIINTSAMIDETEAGKAAEAAKAASFITIFAFSSTAFVAAELEHKLSLVSLRSKVVPDVDLMRIAAVNIGRSDLAIFIVPTILNRDIYPIASACKERGALVMAVTSYDSPKLDDLVDFKFITSDRITARNSLVMSNSLMFLFAIDVFFAAILNGDKPLRQKKLESDASMRSGQALDNYMLEY